MLDMIKHILYVLLVVGRAARWSQEGWAVEESFSAFPFWAALVLWIIFRRHNLRVLREKIQPTSGNHHIWKINILIRSHQVNMWSMIIHLLYFNTQGWQRILTSLKEAKVSTKNKNASARIRSASTLRIKKVWVPFLLWVPFGPLFVI